MFFVKPAIQAGTVETIGKRIRQSLRNEINHSEQTVCSGKESIQDQEGNSPTALLTKNKFRKFEINETEDNLNTYTLVVASQTNIRIPAMVTQGIRILSIYERP
jgi:hypothetical protein